MHISARCARATPHLNIHHVIRDNVGTAEFAPAGVLTPPYQNSREVQNHVAVLYRHITHRDTSIYIAVTVSLSATPSLLRPAASEQKLYRGLHFPLPELSPHSARFSAFPFSLLFAFSFLALSSLVMRSCWYLW
ncbi:uncharacterized protein V2V93DRAFT_374473 [Kockiozyma suomiensis]|uniref:uncharacterized protein n=1 Tax=Kockiozyma suomiensis TaxID=1337062 RepID=UPI003342F5BD